MRPKSNIGIAETLLLKMESRLQGYGRVNAIFQVRLTSRLFGPGTANVNPASLSACEVQTEYSP
jgi:hypothetical protein